MENWSDQPLESFRVKFFLDTNILSYLVTDTFPGLNMAINLLKDSDFVDLVSSKYVIFEFIDVRKKNLYQDECKRLKIVEENSNKKWWHFGKYFSNIKNIDPNSLVRYKEEYRNNRVNFHEFKETIIRQIEEEIEFLEKLNINCDGNILHDNLLSPTKDLNLLSKLSREDSIVSVSSIWSDILVKENFLVLLTRDKPFVDSFKEIDLQYIFDKYGLTSPIIEYIESMQLDGTYHLSLTNTDHDKQIPEYITNKIKELIIKRNEKYFLGKTISCGNGPGFPSFLVCFRLNKNTPLNNNLYLTIIGKDLDFIYSTKLPVSDFYDQTKILKYPLQKDITTDISFKPMIDNNGEKIELPNPIISRLRENGNLVFINPDAIE